MQSRKPKLNPFQRQVFYQRNLPHYQPAGATLFVTFRLAGSIPVEILKSQQEELQKDVRGFRQFPIPEEHNNQLDIANRIFFQRWDQALHNTGSGPKWLQNPEIAGVVARQLQVLDHCLYDLAAYCIMPNHVHLVFAPCNDQEGKEHSLAFIMRSIKGPTAREANRLLGREGSFWHHESYDRAVRSPSELERIIEYLLENPVKAGLVQEWQEWPWKYKKDDQG